MAKTKLPAPTSRQLRAWEFYGLPDGVAQSSPRFQGEADPIGELGFVVGWVADQMSRMQWRVKIDGSEDWTITTTDNETIRSDADQDDNEEPTHPMNASRALLEQIMWNERTVREVAINLFVAGELHYALDHDVWRVISVIRSGREKMIESATIKVRGIWPHPADPSKADAPTFKVLGVLDDMRWLNSLSRSQSSNRVGMRGLLLLADKLKMAGAETSEGFWDDLVAGLSRPMDDPHDVAPLGIIGPAELVKGSGNGAEGATWIIPDFPYDEKIDARMEKLVTRLAYGLPIPPEILLGLQATSRATAFQVEGAAYRAHVEPAAMIVAKVATDTLKLFLPGQDREVEVIPDPTDLLARRHSVQDVLDAFDRGVVTVDYLLEVLGIPTRAKATDADIRRWLIIQGKTPTSSTDPANVAAIEPVLAASKVELPADQIAEVLQRIDSAVFHELVGQAGAAVAKAWERIGARLRATPEGKKLTEGKTVSNEELGRQFADASLEALGEDGVTLLDGALAATLAWWEARIGEAQEQTDLVLATGDVEAHWSTRFAESSVELLASLLKTAVREGRTVAADELRTVLDLAGRSD